MKIDNVILPLEDQTIYNVELSTKGIESRVERQDQSIASRPSLLLPTLCHPHIHLDKAFLLTCNVSKDQEPALPDYSDLTPMSGTFQEALSLTSQAKNRYTLPDLLLRGSQLIAESISYGVTSMRAFVEVDHVTRFKCIEAAVQLKKKFAASCYIQICAFAQDPIMSGDHGRENRALMGDALERYPDIEVLGTTPYVESDFGKGLENVKWAVQTALARNLHLDFHLDYNLDESQQAMVYDVIRLLHENRWNEVARGKRVVLGHCTRLTLLEDDELKNLKEMIADLPVAFVGLPTSDLFMMGRPGSEEKCSGNRPRGTLQILHMIKEHGFDACIGVNNVGNAFTPWGNLDPLRLASLGIGLYQGGTVEDATILYECVSTRANRAIGIRHLSMKNKSVDREPETFSNAVPEAFLRLENEDDLKVHGIEDVIPARTRLSIKDVVWDPPEKCQRKLVRI